MPLKTRAVLKKTATDRMIAWGAEQTRTRPLYEVVQAVISEGHPYQLLGKVHNRDIGGPFENRKVSVDLGSWNAEWFRSNYSTTWGWYDEQFVIPMPHLQVQAAAVPLVDVDGYKLSTSEKILYHLTNRCGVPSATSSSVLDAYGATVINSVKPTNPVVDLAEFFGELASERKLFSVPGQAGNPGGEYLNVMFGVLPTWSTYQDLRKAVEEGETLLAQYQRDSGKLVRRQYTPDPTIVTTTSVLTDAPVATPSGTLPFSLVRGGTCRINTVSTEKWKFSGAFTYYLPKEGIWRGIAELDYLYGVAPGIDTAWNLLPFSWLVDYFHSMGAAYSNVSSFALDGLVMPYAYVMREQRTTKEYVWSGEVKSSSGTWTPRTFEATVTTVIQERRPANPFGFGLKPGDLSLRQQSIIAALGITLLK